MQNCVISCDPLYRIVLRHIVCCIRNCDRPRICICYSLVSPSDIFLIYSFSFCTTPWIYTDHLFPPPYMCVFQCFRFDRVIQCETTALYFMKSCYLLSNCNCYHSSATLLHTLLKEYQRWYNLLFVSTECHLGFKYKT